MAKTYLLGGLGSVHIFDIKCYSDISMFFYSIFANKPFIMAFE